MDQCREYAGVILVSLCRCTSTIGLEGLREIFFDVGALARPSKKRISCLFPLPWSELSASDERLQGTIQRGATGAVSRHDIQRTSEPKGRFGSRRQHALPALCGSGPTWSGLPRVKTLSVLALSFLRCSSLGQGALLFFPEGPGGAENSHRKRPARGFPEFEPTLLRLHIAWVRPL